MPLKFLKNNQPWVSEVKQNSLSRGLAAGTPGAGLSRRGPGRSDEGSGLCPVTVSAMCVQRRGSLQGHTGAVTKQSRWSAATPPGWTRTARPTSGCVASCGHEACGGQQVTGVRNASSTVAEAGGGEALAGGSVEAAGGGRSPWALLARLGAPGSWPGRQPPMPFPSSCFGHCPFHTVATGGRPHTAGANGRRTSLLSIPRTEKG